ncbi:zinc-binding dehydrogenase [Pseudonocardia sulfidoxydans]|uniref:zinc-binding dehydrogenase n=1 Tax=Pseudonocardia sulfidoxydans TaxID=54011 RepID=UPI0011BF3D43|nr:zinc-binding dehydrogenase [Pseudonocardia sulfidoxydans]
MESTTPSRLGRRAVLVKPHQPVEIWESPVEPPTGADVLVEVEMAGVCGTDHHYFIGEVDLPGPMVFGHEGIGRVVELGPEAQTDCVGDPIKPGDRVYWVPLKPCHRCHACTILEDTSLCPHQSPGRFRDPRLTPYATYTDFALLPPGMAFFKVPEGTPSEAVIAFGCAMPTMLHAIERLGEIRLGDSVVVQGCGPVGLAATLLARLAGAGDITVIGAPDARLEMARRLGATSTIDLDAAATSAERAEAVLDASDGRGADIVIEAAGKLAAFGEGMQLVARGGRYLVVGLWSAPGRAPIEPRHVNNTNIRIIGSALSRPRHIHQAVQVARRHHERLPLAEAVSHRFGLAQAQQAIESAGRQETVKAVIEPGRDRT